MMENAHVSVMLQEAIEALDIQPNGFYVDATFGRGGHSQAILERLDQQGKLLAIDRDPQAELAAQSLLTTQGQRFEFFRGCFSAAKAAVTAINRPLLGVLLDLGVSSPQLDQALRGFSFQASGPLDMRMDTETGQTLAEKLVAVTVQELADVLWRFGEEKYSKRIAAAIVSARDQGVLSTTAELADVIKQAHPRWQPGKHPATRSFLALRIWVNEELADLEHALAIYRELLAPEGRLVVISFHSLEDRIVKRFMKEGADQASLLPAWLPVRDMPHNKPSLRPIGKALKPSRVECQTNVRARSAVLRVAQKQVN